MRFRIPNLLLSALFALSFSASTAQAAGTYPDFTVLGGGLRTPSTNGACVSGTSLCLTNEVLDLNGEGEATGMVTVADAGNTFASFVFDVASVSFTGSSGNVAEVLFTNMNYSGAAPVFASGDPLVSFTATPVGVGGATVTGNYSVLDSGGGSLGGGRLNLPAVPVMVDCLINSGFGQCNANLFAFTLNLDGVDHDFIHALNVTVDPPLPEPRAGLLALLVMTGFALRRARR